MINPDDLILNCYRLAERFHQNPEVFVEMPLSRVNLHVYYTVRLIEVQEGARMRDKRDGR